MYANLSTNAHVLHVGDKLTRGQIDALARLEDAYVNGRGTRIEGAIVEGALHAFMCNALGECVCSEKRELEV
jgi:hypothetical protein